MAAAEPARTPAPADASATDRPTQRPRPEPGRAYAPARGFTYRREAFGGILYHYEGVQPDPRVTFVNHGFLIDLLDALTANPGTPLEALVAGVQAHCGLDAAGRERVESFFATLIERGALVPV